MVKVPYLPTVSFPCGKYELKSVVMPGIQVFGIAQWYDGGLCAGSCL